MLEGSLSDTDFKRFMEVRELLAYHSQAGDDLKEMSSRTMLTIVYPQVAVANLVDSNVFIRSIILSMSDVLKFKHLDSKSLPPESTSQLGDWTGSDYVFVGEDVEEESFDVQQENGNRYLCIIGDADKCLE